MIHIYISNVGYVTICYAVTIVTFPPGDRTVIIVFLWSNTACGEARNDARFHAWIYASEPTKRLPSLSLITCFVLLICVNHIHQFINAAKLYWAKRVGFSPWRKRAQMLPRWTVPRHVGVKICNLYVPHGVWLPLNHQGFLGFDEVQEVLNLKAHGVGLDRQVVGRGGDGGAKGVTMSQGSMSLCVFALIRLGGGVNRCKSIVHTYMHPLEC